MIRACVKTYIFHDNSRLIFQGQGNKTRWRLLLASAITQFVCVLPMCVSLTLYAFVCDTILISFTGLSFILFIITRCSFDLWV